MSYQSPNISKIAKATPLPDSPAGDQPSDDNNNNSPKATTTQSSSSADFAESEMKARAAMVLCLRFKGMANNYRQSSNFQQRSEGDHPSEEARENAREEQRQWRYDILEDKGETGLNEVLKMSFLLEAEAELRRLNGFDQAEATEAARSTWKRVLNYIVEAKELRMNVDRVMSQFK
jgi:hypothetical protein